MCSVKYCCCCISLEVGAQIIAILNLIFPLAEIAYCVYIVVSLPLTKIHTASIYVVLGVLALFELFCACLFIYGTFKKHANSMWPWIVLAWVKTVVLLVLFTVGVTAAALGATFEWQDIGIFISYVVYAICLIYTSTIANSRRKEIASDDYSQYAPRRTRSNSAIVRNVYVPMTKQLPPPINAYNTN